MCGICGIVNEDPSRDVDAIELLAMRDVIMHRGPDDAGDYCAPGVALGSRRLAILDLSERGHMPMSTGDGRYHIAYNGEVYNAQELRCELERKGIEFRSRTDTEVVLELFAAEGPGALDRLNGMFAFAIWDALERTLFLARDRLGIKPLYYANVDGSFRFASEQKALFASGIRPQFDSATLGELLCFRFVAGEATPFRGVRRLLPGHYLVWRDGRSSERRWWNLATRIPALRSPPSGGLVSWYRRTFDDSVRLRRISDVPVGVLLSGGLDSGSVAASLAEQSADQVHSFTVSFDEKGYDESPGARAVAERWRLIYHDTTISESELLPRLQRATWLNDEPLAHGNELHLWAISEIARQAVTVLLSGEGADETLGGYVRYRPLAYPGLLRLGHALLPARTLGRLTRGRVRKLTRMLQLGSLDAFVLFNSCDVLPGDILGLGLDDPGELRYRRSLLAEASSVFPAEPTRQAMYLDQHTFLCSLLDRNDRMTMGASIECRVPFLDFRLVEGLAAAPSHELLSGRESKPLLRRSLGHRLPAQVLEGRKWGFGVPWNRYLRTVPELRDIVRQLGRLHPVCDGPFERGGVDRLVASFLAGDTRTDSLVRQLVMLVVWHNECIESWSGVGAGRLASRS